MDNERVDSPHAHPLVGLIDERIESAIRRAPNTQPIKVVDCTGLFCPIPIVRGAAALRGVADGEVVEVISTDPGFVPDIQRWARHRSDALIWLAQTGQTQWRAWLQRRAKDHP